MTETILKTYAVEGKERKSNVVALPAVRYCCLCKITKPISEFSFLWKNEDNGASYYRRECKPCRKEVARRPDQQDKSEKRRRRWRDNNREKDWASRTNSNFKKLYSITLEQAFSMLVNQHGMCANRACGKQIKFRTETKHKYYAAVVDHCHETGRVRGILCNPCNKTIGLARESANVLFGLAEYVAKFEQKEGAQ